MTQQNEAIRLAVEAMDNALYVAKVKWWKVHFPFEYGQLEKAVADLRPLLDQTSDGVGDALAALDELQDFALATDADDPDYSNGDRIIECTKTIRRALSGADGRE